MKEAKWVELENCFHPALPKILVVEHSLTTITATGKGLTEDDRFLSAYGEVLERCTMMALICDLELSFDPMKSNFISPTLFVPEKDVAPHDRIEWCIATERQSQQSVYVHRPVRGSLAPRYFDHTSNGCAVGMTIEDATARARNEILERHIFLSHWHLSNLEVVRSALIEKEDVFFREKGWRVQRWQILDPELRGVTCALLTNESDSRFVQGGGILGLSYGLNSASQKSALAEALQALEVYLMNGKKNKDLSFYLEHADGARLLQNTFERERVQIQPISLGKEYQIVRKLDGPIEYYAEVMIENAIPIQLKSESPPRLPSGLISVNPLPNPIG